MEAPFPDVSQSLDEEHRNIGDVYNPSYFRLHRGSSSSFLSYSSSPCSSYPPPPPPPPPLPLFLIFAFLFFDLFGIFTLGINLKHSG